MATISRLLLLVAFIFLIDRGVISALKHVYSASPYHFSQVYFGNVDADILVLGDSRAHRHFGQDVIEKDDLSLINLGLGGNHLTVSAQLYEDYLQRQTAPQMVIVEVSSARFDLKNIGEMMPYMSASAGMREIVRQLDPTYYYASRLLKSLQFNSIMTFRVASKLIRHQRQEYNTYSMRAVDPSQTRRLNSVKEQHREALKKIVHLSEAYNVKPVFIFAPMAYQKAHIIGLDVFVRDIRDIVAPYPMIDDAYFFSDSEDYGARFFSDPTHMSALGAKQWQTSLYQRLQVSQLNQDNY